MAAKKWSAHWGIAARKLSGKGLVLKPPTDWRHVEKFPLSALSRRAQPVGVPVVLGINWYTDFDNPVHGKDGRWWIGRDANLLGSIRGGHCVCLKPGQHTDPHSW